MEIDKPKDVAHEPAGSKSLRGQQTKTELTIFVNSKRWAPLWLLGAYNKSPIVNNEIRSNRHWLAARACASVLSRICFLTGLRKVGDNNISMR